MATKAIYATGRRKTSSARVYAFAAPEEETGTITVNGLEYAAYFPRPTTQMVIRQPLEVTERLGRYTFAISVCGGGKSGQAGAVLLGISRALEKAEPELRPVLKKNGFLTRDARAVERKKPGRHKARKRPQFSKR
jgi:small subunit ribosomal protein S9